MAKHVAATAQLRSAPLREPGTLSDRAARELEARILRGELAPGERLPTETELSAMLGVSRSVIRDAVRTLAARGLVNVRQGHGTVVTEASDAAFAKALFLLLIRSELTVADVVAARVALETQLVPLAAERATKEDIAALENRLLELAEAIRSRDWKSAREEHVGFHLGLLDAIHLPALNVLLRPMQQMILLSWERPLDSMTPESWEPYAAAHQPILAALQARDEEALHASMREHFAVFRRDPFPVMPSERFRESEAVRKLLEEMSRREGGWPDSRAL